MAEKSDTTFSSWAYLTWISLALFAISLVVPVFLHSKQGKQEDLRQSVPFEITAEPNHRKTQ